MPWARSWRLPRYRLPPRARDMLLRQLTQRSTCVAIMNALALLAGWKMAHEKIEALGLLLSLIDTVILAAVQEDPRHPGLPPAPLPDATSDPTPDTAPDPAPAGDSTCSP